MTTPTPCTPRFAARLGALGSGLLLAASLFTAAAVAADKPAAAPAAATKPAAKKAKDKAAAPSKAATPQAKAKASGARPKAASTAKASGKAGIPSAGGKPDAKAAGRTASKTAAKTTAKKPQKKDNTPGPLANFGKVDAPREVVHVANWVSYTRNSNRKAFVLIDKKDARMYVFDKQGKLKSHSPVLLGSAVGDHTAPGIGNKPLSQIKPNERTTPAGRFWARPGKNNHGEDIIWIDYDAAVSMHRLRKVKEEEKRADRMATPEADDNRISNGCVNVPHKFYNTVLKPTVLRGGAYVYVLPETKTPQQLFGSFDVPANVARAPAADAKG